LPFCIRPIFAENEPARLRLTEVGMQHVPRLAQLQRLAQTITLIEFIHNALTDQYQRSALLVDRKNIAFVES
jgi:hypothetical protein